MQIVLSANSPGEIWGWVRPLVFAVRKRLPHCPLTLFLFPCAYATGKEVQVAKTLLGFSRVYSPSESLRYIVFGKNPPFTDRERPVLVHCGGDLMYASFLARRLRARAFAYQWGEKLWDRPISAYLVSHEMQKEILARRGISEDKIRVVGDLVVDAVRLETGNGVVEAGARKLQVAILPGSRPVEIFHMLPFFLRVAERVAEQLPEVRFVLPLSPFVEESEVAEAIDSRHPRVLESSPGLLVENERGKFIRTSRGLDIAISHGNQVAWMRESDCVLTIPGTKSGEAGLLGVPMIVVLPTNRLEVIPYPGIPYLLERIPLVGRRLKRMALSFGLKRLRHVAQPNLLAGRTVVPEIVGNLTPSRVAGELVSLLSDAGRREAIRLELQEIYRGKQGGAHAIVDILEAAR